MSLIVLSPHVPAIAQDRFIPERECGIGYGEVTLWIEGLNWQASSCPDAKSFLLSLPTEGDLPIYVYVEHKAGGYDIQHYGVDIGAHHNAIAYLKSLSELDLIKIVDQTRKNAPSK